MFIFCREALGLLGNGSGYLEGGQEETLEGFGGVTSKYFTGYLTLVVTLDRYCPFYLVLPNPFALVVLGPQTFLSGHVNAPR